MFPLLLMKVALTVRAAHKWHICGKEIQLSKCSNWTGFCFYSMFYLCTGEGLGKKIQGVAHKPHCQSACVARLLKALEGCFYKLKKWANLFLRSKHETCQWQDRVKATHTQLKGIGQGIRSVCVFYLKIFYFWLVMAMLFISVAWCYIISSKQCNRNQRILCIL